MSWGIFLGIAPFIFQIGQDDYSSVPRVTSPGPRHSLNREMEGERITRVRRAGSQEEPIRVHEEKTFELRPVEVGTLEFSFETRAVWASVWGDASAHNDFTSYQRGEDVDLRDDLGLDEGSGLAEFSLTAQFATQHRVGFRTLFGTFSGGLTLDHDFEFNDNVFKSGEHARTTLEFQNIDVGYDYRFLDDSGLRLWGGVGVRWAYDNVGLSSTTLDPHGSMEENKAVYPTLHVDLDFEVSSTANLGLEVWGSPSAVPTLFEKPSVGRFIEGRASIGWNCAGSLFLEGGVEFLWQRKDGKIREPDQHFAVNRVDMLLLGPVIGFRLEF